MKNILNAVGILYLFLSFVIGVVSIYFFGLPVDEFLESNLIAIILSVIVFLQGIFVCAFCAYMVHMLESIEEIRKHIIK